MDDLERIVARSLDAPVELLPWVDELFADVDELGGSAAEVVGQLRVARVPKGFRALDLCCGKGAVALALAQHFDARCHGVDAHAPFIERARRAAARAGLAARVTFECGDAAHFAAEREFDVVSVIAAASYLGGVGRALALARAHVRRGGWIVIDDAFREHGAESLAGEHLLDHRATLAQLCAHGDRVLEERVASPAAERATNVAILARLRARADALCRRRPELAGLVAAYVETQARESSRAGVTSASWLLERGD